MLRGTLFLSTLALLATSTFASTIYVSGTNDDLYTINPTTGATTLIGDMGVEMSDIAIDNIGGTATMFGVSFAANSGLYSINMTTGAATLIGSSGTFLDALAFSPTGTLYAAGGTAGCGPPPASSPACGTLYTVNTSTGHATAVNSTPGGYNSAGDLEFIGNTLYVTSDSSSTNGGGNDTLYTINPATGIGTAATNNLGFQFVYGLAYVPESSTLYGFNDVGNHVVTINPSTGVATSVATYSNTIEITGAAELAPEPGTLAIMALGLATLAGLAFRSRQRA